jgi:hypothetical protein
MPRNTAPPDFEHFSRWVALKIDARDASAEQHATLVNAARAARDEYVRATEVAGTIDSVNKPPHNIEVLQLLAAASTDDTTRPPEMTTARGFRVTLAYDEGGSSDQSSICVLVRCPPERIESVRGETVYLWNGAERFELGQFDSEGKAIGTLPAGIEISLSDFAVGKVKLEEPPAPTDK